MTDIHSELQQGMVALGREGDHGGGTTSELSIDETLLLYSIGWEPVDLVFGLSWWSIPWGSWQWQTGEITEASNAFAGAFAEATEQLRDECERAGGVGVVGVEIELRVTAQHVDVTLTGTAIRRIKQKSTAFEFISDLSGRDFTLLSRSGWWPLGLVAGASFVVAPRRGARQWASQQRQNLELPNLTNALYQTREGAMGRMEKAARATGADGVINVKLREGPLGYNARIMQFVAIGTAVHLRGERHHSIAPEMVVSLDDPVRQFVAESLRKQS